jgi:hypothetical protein
MRNKGGMLKRIQVGVFFSFRALVVFATLFWSVFGGQGGMALAQRLPSGTPGCSVVTGKPYRSPLISTVFYVTSACQKRPVFNPDVYFSHFAGWEDVVFLESWEINRIPDDPLNFLPWGPRRTFQNNSIIKVTSDPRVYLLEDAVIYPFEDEASFHALGFDFSQVEDVTEDVMAKYQKNPSTLKTANDAPVSFVFKYDNDSKVYVLKSENGSTVKSHIQTMDDLKAIARADRIGVIVSATSGTYADGSPTGNASGTGNQGGTTPPAEPLPSQLPSSSSISSSSTIVFTNPAASSTISGTVNFQVAITGDATPASVRYLVGNAEIGTATSSPFSKSFNATDFSNGTYVLSAYTSPLRQDN